MSNQPSAPFIPEENAKIIFPDKSSFDAKLKFSDAKAYYQGRSEGIFISFSDYEKNKNKILKYIQDDAKADVEYDEFDSVDNALKHKMELLGEVAHYALHEGSFEKPNQTREAKFDLNEDGDEAIISRGIHHDLVDINPVAVGRSDFILSGDSDKYVTTTNYKHAMAIQHALPDAVILPLNEPIDSNNFHSPSMDVLRIAYMEACDTHGINPKTTMSEAWQALKEEILPTLHNLGMKEEDLSNAIVRRFRGEHRDSDFVNGNLPISHLAWALKDFVSEIEFLGSYYLPDIDNNLNAQMSLKYLTDNAQKIDNDKILSALPDVIFTDIINKEKKVVNIDGHPREMTVYSYDSAPRNTDTKALFALVEPHDDGTSTVYTPPSPSRTGELKIDALFPDTQELKNEQEIKPSQPKI
jgi:hypothetical protein